ncbi:MAG: hypothetical protein Q9222_001188 [Ikaeria aurantiellina]
MAGAATDSSRMGITLQSYDQVIALSQANINETLRRHFSGLDAKDDLGFFKASAGASSISSQVLPPTIELVDKDDADGALYILHLGEGFYSTVIMKREEGEGEDVEPSVPEKLKMPINGWELAFDVDFAFKPVVKIPDNIARQIPLPGGYSVHQLMINFGDVTRIVQLDIKRSKFPIPENFKDEIDLTALEAGMELFMRTYLKKKLLVKEGHNVLGFAVKAEEAPKDRTPNFIPCASKVQIIGHRAGGKSESFRQDNPYNAFCFTEMTFNEKKEKRPMPNTEIKYSGNWFYDSIGGTLAMSRSLFWDSFMVGKIKEAHVKAVELCGAIQTKLASDKFEGISWCLDGSKPSHNDMCGSYKGTASWGDLAYTSTYQSGEPKHWNKDDSKLGNFWSSPHGTVHTLAKPTARKGEMVIQQEVELSWEEGFELADYFYLYPATALIAKSWNVYIRGSLRLTLYTTITFKTVTSTGDLQVDASTTTTRKEYNDPEIRIGGLGKLLPEALHKLINEWSSRMSDDFKESKQTLQDQINKIDGLFGQVAEGLKNDLNQQNKFVFPGNGTFDMKDPIFSDKGDLMIGLTYR